MPDQTPRARARLVVAYGVRPAHELLREAAGRFHGVPPTTIVLGHECPRCGSDEHGRPLLLPTAAVRAPAHVSLARAGDLSVVALTDVGPVGVDIEAVGAAAFPGFDDVARHPDERGTDATASWVRTEALLKAHGFGLAVDPRDISIDADGSVTWDSPHEAPGPAWLRDLEVPGHVVAVVALPEQDVTGMSVVVEPASDSPSA
ncbi:4'-phosphopantetheinyl transferase family protein [Longivirga aurantiaca]|uniref:4'-phosphopantetheinyl transferase family protein n=1 Tax=Longivirga aurantiaca TaxID=1837743 RepID=A0ABW1T310_9ACTN